MLTQAIYIWQGDLITSRRLWEMSLNILLDKRKKELNHKRYLFRHLKKRKVFVKYVILKIIINCTLKIARFLKSPGIQNTDSKRFFADNQIDFFRSSWTPYYLSSRYIATWPGIASFVMETYMLCLKHFNIGVRIFTNFCMGFSAVTD